MQLWSIGSVLYERCVDGFQEVMLVKADGSRRVVRRAFPPKKRLFVGRAKSFQGDALLDWLKSAQGFREISEPMNPTTYPRPVLSEQQRDMLTSLGLKHRTTDLAIIVEHPDATITRLDASEFGAWIRDYLDGRGWRG